MKTAFLVDCDFFLRRLKAILGNLPAEDAVDELMKLCLSHLNKLGRNESHLYRILVYDCPPLSKKVHYPVSKKALDYSKTPVYEFRTAFHECIRVRRKVALRLGKLGENQGHWVIRPDVLKQLLSGKMAVGELEDKHFNYDVEQKGVDMRIGLDIASISSKRLVDQMVLIAGDSDFVPAAKTARREGVDFILDSMGAPIPAELHEHIDDLQSVLQPPPPEVRCFDPSDLMNS